MLTIAALFAVAGVAGGTGAYIHDKNTKAELSVEWKPIGRRQWDIGGVPMDFEKIAQFKIIPAKNNRVKYQFTMNDGEVRIMHVGANFGINGTTNEVRACTQGRALGLGSLF